ncbi:CPBP family intramembrane glutamic endopeptidase [Methylobacter luteus]|uniref:CPBP family intramembrane glutamic endopeptidase n=1 Tax=Methylobacter luteus TaxID=415 RepID=UPI0003F6A2EF|nr:CPBP family intramembrane glutamic endopeptidase [Methylobacter luteus]
MAKTSFNPDTFFKQACYFEASLIVVAVVLGWIAGINPFENLRFSEAAIAYGVLGTAPLFIVFGALEQLQIDSLAHIRRLLIDTLGPGLNRYHWSDVFMLAAIAGVSEEILFRGVIQPWIESSWGMTIGLIGSNIIFGLVHAVTPLYALMAALVGLYLGWTLDYGGDRNLLTPIIIHGLYDFLAFMALIRAYRTRQ